MPYHTTAAPLPTDTFDIVIVGGGTAACVLAGRLSRSTPPPTILILETGPNNLNDPTVTRPARYLEHQDPSSPRLKTYPCVPSASLGGRALVVPVGNILGGGSSVNFLMYTRASASDYDDWECPGWSSEELKPLLRRLENSSSTGLGGDTHGKDGPVSVSFGGFREERVMRDGESAVRELGYEVVADANDLNTGNGFSRWPKTINPTTGRRSDAGHGYLHPVIAEGKENLHILCGAQVVRVLLDASNTATGVEYVPSIGAGFSSTEPVPKPLVVHARKLVVVSAGAISTPCILERSGIGRRDVLLAAGVEPVVEIPAVGEHYQDHNVLFPVFQAAPEVDTHDDISSGNIVANAAAEKEFAATGTGKYTTNILDFAGKIRPCAKEIQEMGPAFLDRWVQFFEKKQDKPVGFIAIIDTLLAPTRAGLDPKAKFLTFAMYSAYPIASGHVHITSASPYAVPETDSGILEHEADLAVLVWVYKVAREVARRMPCVISETPQFHPAYSSSSAARCSSTPTRESVVYSAEDNAAIEEWIKKTVQTTWHSLGTCRMGNTADGASVVDPQLRVWGTRRLMLADMSVAPGNVGANTNNTALLVGERAAVLAAEALGVVLAV